jgi:pyruvate,water dikinase
VTSRRRVWNHTLRQQGPKFLRGWTPLEDSTTTATDGSETEIVGIAASPGSAQGVARIVYDVSGLGSVHDGDILVTRQTDPSWTTVFGRIAALVLETGGVLSHGTSLCREYGLPCVTAVERATTRIRDGSRIEVSGSAGTIRVIAHA